MSQARLEIQEDGISREVALAAPRMTIGHDARCDIVLGAGWIAPEHAHFEAIGGAHRVVVDDATRGVLFGGRQVDDHVLHDGDVLRLPDPITGAMVTVVYHNPLAPPIERVQHFATPPGKAVSTIGRAGADIVLDQPLVAKNHAELLWKDGGHVLRDSGSTHGTFVNGVRIDGEVALRAGDVVQIGTFRLTYDGDSLDSLDEHGAIRLDARGLRRVVGSGESAHEILSETTLSIEPCELVALVGASGAGKSTLLMSLCGFRPADEGRVHVNGDDLYAGFDAYRSLLGYVPQDDILHRALTVERALSYAARLRLPADTAPEELDQRIHRVLESVEMLEHRDKRIDQLSGGQRKRVSIASEILVEPSLLFLDEPTSGLDPGLERKMMYTLRKLADGGRTIVLVTHATGNIRLCDHIVFMVAGRVVWFGPPFQALEFFAVDDFADIYTKTEGVADPDSALVREELAAEYAGWVAAHPGASPLLAHLWQQRFHASLQHEAYTARRLARAPEQPTSAHADRTRRARQSAHSSWRQLSILARRYLDLIIHDRRNLALLLLQAPLIGLLLLLVARPDSLTGAGRFEAKKLLFMLATVGVWFGVINAAREVCKESAILRRERLGGIRCGPYLASKVVVLVLLVLVQSALLLGVLALEVRMPAEGVLMPAALEIYATLTLSGIAGIALGLCISVVAATPDKATSLIPLVVVPQVLFAGLMFNLRGATEVLSWLTASRWSMDAMGTIVRTNELRERIPLPFEPHYVATAGNLLHAWGMLAAHAVAFVALSWVVLRWLRA